MARVKQALDITVATPSCKAGLKAGAATHTGAAARILEGAKRRKYPGIAVTPFCVEAYGHFGESALSFVRFLSRGLPAHERGLQVSGMLQTISVTLQRANAKLVVQALGLNGASAL